jgi:uncharacterized protein (TIGR02118 family)
MSVSLQVLYPVSDGSRFDLDYYLNSHMPLVDEYMGAQIERVLVTKGLAGGPDVPPGFHAVATIVFHDQDAMNAAMAGSKPVLEDIPNFTNVTPQMLIGEVIA